MELFEEIRRGHVAGETIKGPAARMMRWANSVKKWKLSVRSKRSKRVAPAGGPVRPSPS